MIYTSYFGKLKKLPLNIIPITICGKVPDWYTGLQYKTLAPKYDFFIKWKENHDDNYYIECFQKQVLNPLNITNVLNELQSKLPIEIKENLKEPIWINKDYHIALICYEKEGDFCHRKLVANWFQEHNILCKEFHEQEKEEEYER